MHHIARRAAGFAVVAGCLTASGAQAAAIGTIFGSPHITGTVRGGEFEEVKNDLTGHFDKPLSLSVDPGSGATEVMRIGLWLREQRPAIKLRGTCVGSCAWFMLDSGRSLEIAKGSVIAFSVYPELWAHVREQLDRGEISIDDERSRTSAQSFIAKVPEPIWSASAELRDQRRNHARVPAWIQQFVEETTMLTIRQLRHSEEDWSFNLSGSQQQCLWWIPDAEGLRQLGLDPGSYTPPDAATAGKKLGVPASALYIGPALREMPAHPLCDGLRDDPKFQFKPPML